MAIAAVLVISAIDAAVGLQRSVLPLYVLVPVLAATGRPDVRRPLWISGLTMVLAAVLSYPNWQVRPLSMISALIGVAVMGVITSFGVRLFVRQRQVLDELEVTSRTVQQIVQGMVQRPVPERLRSLRAEVRYLSPLDARMPADMCSVEDTPFGVRMLIGDVAGRGGVAVGVGNEISCAFRDLSWTEERLPLLVSHLHSVLARCSRGDEFVTALLAQATGATIHLMSCGHPPPILLRDGQATEVEVRPNPPLGLLHLGDGRFEPTTVKLGSSDRLLLYTNGVTDARNDEGRSFPLVERMMARADEDLGVFLDALRGDLLGHAQGRLTDDAILLLIQVDRSPVNALSVAGLPAALPSKRAAGGIGRPSPRSWSPETTLEFGHHRPVT